MQPLFGPYGSASIHHAADILAAGGDACWFHMFDPAVFDACARHGLAACVEFKTFRADFDQHPELIPIGIDGRPIRYGDLVQGVCLSQTEFLEATAQALRDGVRTYQPAGIWLDYLTYAGWFEEPQPDLQQSCFCRACVADFCQATAIDATDPQQIVAEHLAAWTHHKCRRIAGFAAEYAAIIRTAQPGCMIGAYMCPWIPTEFDQALTRIFAQDYTMLAPAIDIFTPLMYGEKSGRPTSWGREFLEAAPQFVPADRRVQLILDARDGPDSLTHTAAATAPSYGLQVFDGARIFSDTTLTRAFADAVSHIRSRLV